MKTLTLILAAFATSAYAQEPSLEFNRQKLVEASVEKSRQKVPPRTPKEMGKMFNGGSEGTGGGDICEDRIKVIRDDLESWMQKGGAESLVLPDGFSSDSYRRKMFDAIGKAKIKCVGPGDQDFPVQVNGTPKICKFKKKSANITCDINKFQSLGESDQYVLIHHEYAGIADIEIPNADDSNYEISNQITDYLVDTTVKRLAVKERTPLNLKVGTLFPANPRESYVLGQKIHVTRQSYGLTVNGQVEYGRNRHNWYAVINETMPEGSSVYIAKGKLQVVYGRSVNGSGILCEYPIQVKLTEMGTNSYFVIYQFPLSVANSIALPGGACPVVNTNTLWASGNFYALVQ